MCWKPAFCTHRVWCNSSFYQEVQRSLCNYWDGGFPWTMCLQQILFQARENCYRMLWNVEESFWGTKTQSSQWKSPGLARPKKTRQLRSNIKSMLICFFDQKGIVHKEFTVNAAFYVEVLKCLWENVCAKEATWSVAEQHTAAPPWQCASPCCPPDLTVFGR